ncbi:MAG: GTP 3',8-cyclase MoaA [Magnetococcales bacterium]|nr:GTP 3',8-cyclase MoaA [Magnetococcales bacterium]
MALIDSFGRTITYLRVSVTDRCNLKCFYCRVGDDRMVVESQELLTFEELTRVIRIFSELGIEKIRITGGEPLLRKNVITLIRDLAKLPGMSEVSLSTNAMLLERFAHDLAHAGLRRVNISLDSLKPETFARITRGGQVDGVLRGIKAAVAAGLHPVKVNMVVMRGVNDDEILDMVAFAKDHGLILRFIETMPIGEAGLQADVNHMPAAEILARVQSGLGRGEELVAESGGVGNGPANYFGHLPSGTAIGVISAKSRNFCASCNRMRISSRGALVFCLGSSGQTDLKGPLRSGISDAELRALIVQSVQLKPSGHTFQNEEQEGLGHRMSRLGG